MTDATGPGGGVGLGNPQRLVQGVALPAVANEAAALMLSEYTSAPALASSWDMFVAHNWLPVLSLALGTEWRSKYDSEVAAMIALQLSLQPPGSGVTAESSRTGDNSGTAATQQRQLQRTAAATTMVAGAPSGDAAATLPRVGVGAAHQFMAAHLPVAAAATGDVPPGAAAELRDFTVEAVDVDGKRRRLRRKREASPDSPYSTAAPVGAENGAIDTEAAPSTPSSMRPPAPQQMADGGAASGVGAAGGGSVGDTAGGEVAGNTASRSEEAVGAGGKPSLVQRVIRQVSKLSISTLPAPAASAAPGGSSTSSGASGHPPAPAAAAATPAAVEARARHAGEPPAGGSGGTSAARPELQRGLLDSLSLVHSLSQRIVANLKEEVAARGLTLPQHVPAPGSCGDRALPLSMLLGGSLVDRMDLLGRTALHVAAATGRADIVRQLVAAGASAGKALPMDYRTLLKQHPDVDSDQGQQQQQEEEAAEVEDGEAHGAANGGACGPKACVDISACATCGTTGASLGGGLASKGGHTPPPKRGWYVTAGPPEIGTPSLQYCTPLHLAALYGHLEVVASLLSTGQCDANAKNIDGATPLHVAAFSGHAHVVAQLCRTPSIQLDAPDLQGRTPLHLAASRGHSGVVVELWARGALIDPCDLHGWTALHYASRGGHTEVAAQLVIAGASVAACDPHAITPAHLAAERGFSSIVGKLLLAGYVADSVAGPLADGTEGGTALHLATAQGCEAAAHALLRAGADPHLLDFSARNALDLAVLHGHMRLALPLLEAGCWFTNGSDYGECPPQPGPADPASWRQLELLQCLVAEAPMQHAAWAGLGDGSEMVAESFRLPFSECAARAGQLEVLQALEGRGLDLGSRAGCAVLAAAVHSGAAPLVAWLLEGGRCDVAASLEQEDLLHEAASRGDVEVLAALMAAAGDGCLAQTDGRGLGRTPLHSAVIHGQAAAAELLILGHQRAGQRVGPDQDGGGLEGEPASAAASAAASAGVLSGLDAVDNQGFTALCWAALKGSTATLCRLLAAGAGTGAASAEGQTPLHLAAKAGHVGAVHALLEAGAEVAPMDVHGCMPLHYCALRGDLALFVLLFSPSAPALAPAAGAGAALLTAAIRGGSGEMVGIVLMTGAATPLKCREAGQMPVHAAAREGCLDVLQYLYGSGFDMSELDAERKSPLHHAPIGCGQTALTARRGADHRQVAEVLLASGCRVDAQDAHGCTPLHFAAGAGAVSMLCRFVELSLRGTAGIDLPDSIGWTPLFWACNNGHAAAAERLLAEGASPWSKDCNQRLPLHFASEAGHVACVRLLVSHMWRSRDPGTPVGTPASGLAALELKDQNGQTPVQLAAEHGHPDCVALLLDGDGTAEAKRRTALHLAAQQGRAQVAGQVIAAQRLAVSVKDADGWLPIHYAAAAGHADIVQALLAAGSDAEELAADGDSPLHKAAIGGHQAAVRLLKARTQPDQRNSSGSTPLYNAASQGHLGVMRDLVEEGASVDAVTANGCSPLYIAANNGFAEAAGLLLELGADADLETTSGCTPLHAAALNGHAAVAECLVAAGCDVDLQSQNGSSALHNAASGGHASVVDVLLGARADCDVQNSNGNTPLHLAAGKGWLEVAERLAGAGADMCIKNSKGWLAIQSASNSGCFEVVLKLVQLGSPWRLKGDADVVKLLSKKSSYKPSYVEGRLRLADKERQRRLAKQQAAEVGGPVRSGEADLQQAAAQADAVMAALLEEEEANKERAERQKAKKAAKKQKAAAKRQQQEEEQRKAAEEELQQREVEVREAEAEAVRNAAAEQLAALATLAPGIAGKVISRATAPEQQQEGSLGSGKQATAAAAAKAASKAAAMPRPAPKVLGGPSTAHPCAASPSSSVLAVGLKSSPPNADKQGRGGGSHPASPAPRTAPQVVAATHSQASTPAKPAAAAAPSQSLPQQARTAAAAHPATAGQHAATMSGQLPPARPAPAAPALGSCGAPIMRLAPWAGVAAARASAVQQQQQQQRETSAIPQQAHGITRPAHISSTLAPGLMPGTTQLQHPLHMAAPAASKGLPSPTGATWPGPTAAPPRLLPPAVPTDITAGLQPPAGSAALGDGRINYLLHTTMQQQQQQQQPTPAAVQAALSRLGIDGGGSVVLPPAQKPAPALLAPAMVGIATQLRQQQQQLQAGSSPASSAGFVPLFGLNLPTFQGLGVDWSVQGSTAATAFGSPARHTAEPQTAVPPAVPATTPAAVAGPGLGGGVVAAGFVGGSFSPSDASSIESEADDLLNGGHVSRLLAAGTTAVAAAVLARVPPPAAKTTAPATAADADDIDDVLRLQPWLNE